MTLKTTIAALILATAPGLAFAMGCSGGYHSQTTAQISCPEGQTWDGEAQVCAPNPSA